MRTFVKPGNEINVTMSADVAGGSVLVVGSLVGVLAKSCVTGEVGVMEISGVHKLPKTVGDVVSKGAKLYYDDTAKEVTINATGTAFIGYAEEAAANSDVTVRVLLARPGS